MSFWLAFSISAITSMMALLYPNLREGIKLPCPFRSWGERGYRAIINVFFLSFFFIRFYSQYNFGKDDFGLFETGGYQQLLLLFPLCLSLFILFSMFHLENFHSFFLENSFKNLEKINTYCIRRTKSTPMIQMFYFLRILSRMQNIFIYS